MNASIYWSAYVTPKTVDDHIALAKEGGFRMMMIYYPALVKGAKGDSGYGGIGEDELRDEYRDGFKSLEEMLGKIKAAGITPGLHVLHTFIGFKSSYVTPVADHRLNLVRHFTLSRPLGTDAGDVYVEEDPSACPTNEHSRILRFGGELIGYESFTTARPYRFTGVKRGEKETNVTPHPQGEIGGVLDVCEYGAHSCYIDQNSSLQDEIAEKIARIYNAGFRFMYFDGSEGADVPYGIHVPGAQWKVVSRMKEPPLFTSGAAKGHFDWHFLGGANAFDVFPPEKFKAMIVRWPVRGAAHAPELQSAQFRLVGTLVAGRETERRHEDDRNAAGHVGVRHEPGGSVELSGDAAGVRGEIPEASASCRPDGGDAPLGGCAREELADGGAEGAAQVLHAGASPLSERAG